MNDQPIPLPISRGAALAHGCCSPQPVPPGTSAPPPVPAALDPAALPRLRGELGLSLAQLAVRLGVSPPSAARAEGEADMLLSALARHVAALGGTLELVARFPDRRFPLNATGD